MKADTGRSNYFTYKENVYAAYANFSRQIKFKYQLGIRIENAAIKGTSVDLKIPASTIPIPIM